MSLVGGYSMAHQSYGHNTMAPGTPSPEALYSTYYSHPSPPGHNHQTLYPGWGYGPGYSYSPEAAAAAAQSFQEYNLSGGVVSMGPVPGSPHEEYIIEMVDGCGRVVKRRSSANKKERRRTMSINNAFAELRECIPNVPVDTKVRRRTVSINNAFTELRECIPNVPVDTKLSKIKTLRLATSYISYLMEVLHNEDSTTITNLDSFKADINNMNKQNNNNNSDNNNTQQKEAGASPSNSHSSMGARVFSSSPSSSSTSSSSSSSTSSSIGSPEAKRGRTGWPQAVWAQELKK